MKPLSPVKPQEKLPEVFHLAVVPDPEKGSGMFAIVLSKTQGDAVLARRVMQPVVHGKEEALDELNRVALRVFYFEEGEELIEP